MEYPSISVCLSFEEIQKLEKSCLAYLNKAAQLCGPSITIRKFFEQEAMEKQNFFQKVSQRSKENMDKWSEEQMDLANQAADIKRARLKELTTQLEQAKQRKIDDRKANVELELKILKEAELLEDQRIERENINLRKRIEYYQELSDDMKTNTNISTNLQLHIPENLTSAASDKIPLSAGTQNTDFGSCDDEMASEKDSTSSEYAECINDEQLKTEETDDEYVGFSERSNENPSSHQLNMQQSTTTFKFNAELGGLKRSASDIINSNEIAATAQMSDLQRNKLQALSGSNMTQIVAQQVKTMSNEKIAEIPVENNFKGKLIKKI